MLYVTLLEAFKDIFIKKKKKLSLSILSSSVSFHRFQLNLNFTQLFFSSPIVSQFVAPTFLYCVRQCKALLSFLEEKTSLLIYQLGLVTVDTFKLLFFAKVTSCK